MVEATMAVETMAVETMVVETMAVATMVVASMVEATMVAATMVAAMAEVEATGAASLIRTPQADTLTEVAMPKFSTS